MELALTLVSIFGFVAIVLYATWYFGHRLRRGESPSKSFAQWLKHLLEAVLGL